ncbi:FAD-dependent oxidoreductase [Klenkia sp. PcliD-1-E]|uniref:FAD-dependent oxidoreductase n=1 Tax=Klenkia sp. PcliD-1-E TaxID=2954492 RepID=UPI0020982C61|nr:FAD-dependent oxidoreductase [Klenkia sp. PcliD-1-E]MCO7219693.1 FAD-dependent oxidoreductase [Klenkia sp. PcliD-1-E]
MDRPLRVAVVGAGPAGIYAAEALADQDDVPVAVDLLDRLPVPFGLVRHGIAPDHLKMRALADTLRHTLDHPSVRFVGDVELGQDLSVEDLRAHADAVVFTHGASGARRLGVEGEDLPGSLAATDVVAWYTGHPDADRARVEQAVARARDVVVVGVGNVALDVARVLARCPTELEATDMPQHVLDALAAAPVERITLLGRRGPAQASFTTQELRELGHLSAAVALTDTDGLDEESDVRAVARNLATLREFAEHVPEPGKATVRLRFFTRPVRLTGTDRVTGVVVERVSVDPADRLAGTRDTEELPADLVVAAVGYTGLDLPGLPVSGGVVPNEGGRVLRDGVVSPGEYVAGWIKRGPTGVVGTNKHDARETVAALLADAPGLPRVEGPDLVETLRARGCRPVLLENWRAIDDAEHALGATKGRARTTIHEREALRAAAWAQR